MAKHKRIDDLLKQAYMNGYRDGCNDAFEMCENLKTGKIKMTSFHDFYLRKDTKNDNRD